MVTGKADKLGVGDGLSAALGLSWRGKKAACYRLRHGKGKAEKQKLCLRRVNTFIK